METEKQEPNKEPEKESNNGLEKETKQEQEPSQGRTKRKTRSNLLGRQEYKLKKPHIVGIITAIVIVFISTILLFTTEFFDKNLFVFMTGIAIAVLGLPFFMTLIVEGKAERNKEEMFLEFTRDLVESVRSGTSISKSILNVKSKDYGALNIYIDKLANQISMGIPVKNALDNFSRSVKSKVISRAITLIQEAERAGGRIETILESVASSVGQIEKLRKERKAAIYNLIVQGYIVFLIFIAIMLVMQFRILPITTELGSTGDLGGGLNLGGIQGLGASSNALGEDDMARAFMYLLITQGFFAGIVIGKISEGSVRSGLKHSFILVVIALLISTGANVFL